MPCWRSLRREKRGFSDKTGTAYRVVRGKDLFIYTVPYSSIPSCTKPYHTYLSVHVFDVIDKAARVDGIV